MTKQNVKSDNQLQRSASRRSPDTVASEKTPSNQTRVDAPHLLGPSPSEATRLRTRTDKKESIEDSNAEARIDTTANEDAANRENPKNAEESQDPALASCQPCAADEQLRQQAAQLGEQLHRRQRELDHREARLNARVAQLENDTRTARLWLTEGRRELDDRQGELLRKDQRLQESEKKLSESEASIANREKQLDERFAQLTRQFEELNAARKQFESQRQNTQNQLDAERQRLDVRRQASIALVRQALAGLERRRRQVEAKAKRLMQNASQPNKELLSREAKSLSKAEQYRRRMRQLLEAEASLASEKAEVNQLRQRFLSELDELNRRDQLRRQQAAVDRAEIQAEMDEKRGQLARRSEKLDREENALRRLRNEMGEMYRAGLEMRLAVEELWIQLSGTVPPAALTRSLGQIRARLAEAYRAEKSELSARKRKLGALGAELTEQHKLVSRQKAELDAWIVRRRREIEQQAARLVAREQQLLEQEARLERTSGEWTMQRLAYQQQIRDLRERLDELAESGRISSGMCGVF